MEHLRKAQDKHWKPIHPKHPSSFKQEMEFLSHVLLIQVVKKVMQHSSWRSFISSNSASNPNCKDVHFKIMKYKKMKYLLFTIQTRKFTKNMRKYITESGRRPESEMCLQNCFKLQFP